MEVIELIAIRSDPAAYLRSFQPDQPQFEALRQGSDRSSAAASPTPATMSCRFPDGPTLKLGVDNEQVALLRKRLDVPVEDGGNENGVRRLRCDAAVQRLPGSPVACCPMVMVGAWHEAAAQQQQHHREAASPAKIAADPARTWSAGAGCRTTSGSSTSTSTSPSSCCG